jgi:hypothetical protein
VQASARIGTHILQVSALTLIAVQARPG